ncbi:isoleucine--tRNA ligase [Plakobranchus ocellatus]|uniref:isoleucine--tRNA ligase n=1 Tax=Plakobranchus ocellatus TaxID=259542 RepID=A0AAV4C718_9GAST|nr:isoleucine--tRNA ligase [Plakobranchus ocellatus]
MFVPVHFLVRKTLKFGFYPSLRIKKSTFKADKASSSKRSRSKRFTNTLNLPQTSFPLTLKHGAAANREQALQRMIGFQSVYQWQREQSWNRTFVLHDGPPYANGKTHVGHVVNKVLKDITNRYRVLKKHKVHYIPGWDCHGMPIESKAIVNAAGEYLQLSPIEIRSRAKELAEEVVKQQQKSFLRWGIMGDWSSAYKTFSQEYEATQIGVFCDIYEKGYIYRDYMPVYWSPSSQTALAEAELEYNHEHVSKSVFVKFPISTLRDKFKASLGDASQVWAVVWTTTPWTLPFNRALCYNPKLRYIFVRDTKRSDVYLCEAQFVDKLATLVDGDLKTIFSVDGFTLERSEYINPLSNEHLQFVASNHVTSGKGTGLVHAAPAHGHEDFKVASTNNLPKECHVDGRGVYVSGVTRSLLGKTIGVDADDAVLDALQPFVLKVEDYTHSYPYDWRTKKPVIIRASQQWFIDTQQLCPLAVESLQNVKITPEQSKHSMIAELYSRPYWCISRQRTWGVPIPVFYHKISGEPLICRETVQHVQDLILEHGSDCWWNLPSHELLPDSLLAQIQKGQSSDYEKGNDILDVWFDSGVSWASVLKDVGGQADVYMEGIDQFKGWFQTSLLTSLAVRGKAPYRQIVTHGFATDEAGMKMSKSLGNVIEPETIIHGGKDKEAFPSYGVDILRWWVAHSHHHQNINLGPTLLKQFSEDVFKVRKCLRHMLGNLFDFDPKVDVMPYNKLTAVDKYMLYNLYLTIKQIEEGYKSMAYNKVIQNIEKFVYSDMSMFYFNNTKDRCYCSEASGELRKASQTVHYHVTRSLVSAIAPVLPHLAEEVFQHMPGTNMESNDTDSVFKIGWITPESEWGSVKSVRDLVPVFDMRRAVADTIGLEGPVQFDIYIRSSPKLHALLKELQPERMSSTSSLCEIFQTSRVFLFDKPPKMIPEDDVIIVRGSSEVWDSSSDSTTEVDFSILVTAAQLHICERCRRYTAESYGTPCERCLGVMAQDWAT